MLRGQVIGLLRCDGRICFAHRLHTERSQPTLLPMSSADPLASQVPALRVRSVGEGEINDEGDYVLYWMIANRRPTFNFSLFSRRCGLDTAGRATAFTGSSCKVWGTMHGGSPRNVLFITPISKRNLARAKACWRCWRPKLALSSATIFRAFFCPA